MISLKEVDNTLKILFGEAKVLSFDSVYELSEDKKYYKLVFSLHNLEVEMSDTIDTTILHTKFIFRTDLEKTKLVENSFWYLKDIDCSYVKKNFDTNDDLIDVLEEIINEDNFGEDMSNLSNFISEAPSSSINDFLSQVEYSLFSVTTVMYNPSLKLAPCQEMTFDFDITLNNGEHIIKLSIEKVDSTDVFKFYYHLSDTVEEIDVDDISQLAQTIGDHLILLFNKYLK